MAVAQEGDAPPLRQSELTFETAERAEPLSLRDASRDDRWLGVPPRSVRWAPDGSGVFFRWHPQPSVDDVPDADPWFFVDREGRKAKRVPLKEATKIPAGSLVWSRDGHRAAWVLEGKLYVFDSSKPEVREAVSTQKPCRSAVMSRDGAEVSFMIEEDLYLLDVDGGTLRQVTRKHEREADNKTEAAEWLKSQQQDLFDLHRRRKTREEAAAETNRHRRPDQPQPIPVAPSLQLEDVRLSPDKRHIIFRARKENEKRSPTRYIDFVSKTGYAEVETARPKVGEPEDESRFGIIRNDPTVDPDEVEVNWVELSEAGDRATIIYGPSWNLEGTRVVIQVISRDHKDMWIAGLDMETGKATVIEHDRDDAWLGGPPVQVNYYQPALFEWLPGDRFVFASERSGFSHLYLVESDGTSRALTSGEWEVRDAALSRDKTSWLIRAGREHPCDDHLYTMPAAGGEMTRLTTEPGRHEGFLSPDGERVAVMSSDTTHLPDLYLRNVEVGGEAKRITVSGTDAFYRHPLVAPETVSFPHPDGRLLWAALYQPEKPNGAAVMHIHGGGYRQFSHRGWSVYGYADHLGALNHFVGQGYTVLDFDYRGSAGFGRDYRTDIYRSMGMKDIDGMVTAVDYLKENHGIDEKRVGVYGISYGGFATLMALFRYPGVFGAGVANASVTDWAHYNHGWTSRILNLPYEDEEAYRRSSPIYYADGLADPLLIVHGLIDDNVQFQDAARLVQKLIELEKDFEVMYYPAERHVIETESSRYDYLKRLAAFFEKHLLLNR
jgi:dipeptidyl aminopeptidase/acylaminoacyl peptidase